MLKAIIIEDEEGARNILKFNLKQHCADSVEICGEAADVKDGVKLINAYNPDIVFLDIEMPNYSGFELLDFFKEINFEIIFITAYSSYALKAFEVSAIDYLLKPIEPERLVESIEKVIEKKTIIEDNSRLKILEKYLNDKKLDKISIPYIGGYYSLTVSKISVIKAERAYSYIYHDSEKLLVSKNLSKIEQFLIDEPNFIRIHRSYVINTDHIISYNRENHTLKMEGDITVKYTKDKFAEIKKKLKRL